MSSPNDLVLYQPHGTGELVLGDTGATTNTVDIAVTLGGVTVTALCREGLRANVTASLAGVTALAWCIPPPQVAVNATLAGVSVELWANYQTASSNPNDLIFQDAPVAGELIFSLGDGGTITPCRATIATTLGGVTVHAIVTGGIEVNVAATVGGVTVNAMVAKVLKANVTTTLAGVDVALRVLPVRKIDVAATLAGVDVALIVVPPTEIGVTVMLGGVSAMVQQFYDNRVTNWLDTRFEGEFQPAVQQEKIDNSDHQTGVVSRAQHAAPWDWATEKVQTLTASSELGIPLYFQDDTNWELGKLYTAQSSGTMQLAIPNELPKVVGWELTEQTRVIAQSAMQAGIYKSYPTNALPWGCTSTLSKWLLTLAKAGITHTTALDFLWQTAVNPQPGEHLLPITLPLWFGTDLVFAQPPGDGELVFGEADYVTPGVVVETQRVYMVTNSAGLYRNGVLIPTFNMSLSLDVASWTWGFSASAPATTLDSFEPASNGAPVEVTAVINGVSYVVLIEGISRSRSFGKDGLSIQGRGKTALLDTPYSPVLNFSNLSDRTASQLMADVLTVNNVPMGWDVDFGLDDWLVPGSTFSHQGSYIAALNAIAKAAGGYVQPHPSLNAIKVLPLYPFMPRDWLWADYTLPASLTVTEGISWTEKARYNRVYVSGVQRGVLGRVTEVGTAGDLLAPMVSDPLITTAGAARQRGISVLGDTGRIATVSLKVPVMASTGIIPPGKFVKYTDQGVDRLGIVRSVSVDVGLPEIWQTLSVETHVN